MLADRVGIIDRGKIVAEGTPESLKAEIGRPSVEAVPSNREERDAVAEVLSRFGGAVPSPPGTPPCGWTAARISWRWCARWTRPTSEWPTSSCTQPSLDDVFLAKTGRKLEAEETPEEVAA